MATHHHRQMRHHRRAHQAAEVLQSSKSNEGRPGGPARCATVPATVAGRVRPCAVSRTCAISRGDVGASLNSDPRFSAMTSAKRAPGRPAAPECRSDAIRRHSDAGPASPSDSARIRAWLPPCSPSWARSGCRRCSSSWPSSSSSSGPTGCRSSAVASVRGFRNFKSGLSDKNDDKKYEAAAPPPRRQSTIRTSPARRVTRSLSRNSSSGMANLRDTP